MSALLDMLRSRTGLPASQAGNFLDSANGYNRLTPEEQAMVTTTVGGNWGGNGPRLVNQTRMDAADPTGLGGRFAGMAPLLEALGGGQPQQQMQMAQGPTEMEIAQAAMNAAHGNNVPRNAAGQAIPGVSTIADSTEGFDGPVNRLRGQYSEEARAALNDPDRLEKQRVHHEKVAAMQPRYDSMEDRQAQVLANAKAKGVGRDARMSGGYGPLLMNKMIADAGGGGSGAQGNGGPGSGNMAMAMNPLMMALTFGPQMGAAAMNFMGQMQGNLGDQNMAQAQIEAQKEMARDRNRTDLEKISAQGRADQDLINNPRAGAAKQGRALNTDEKFATGDVEGGLRDLATTAPSFEVFKRMAVARGATPEQADAAWAQIGKEPEAPSVPWYQHPIWTAPGRIIGGALRDYNG